MTECSEVDGQIKMALLLVLILRTAVAQWTGQLSAYQTAAFQNPDPDNKFNHLILHNYSTYIGAVNSLYRLNDQLLLQANASTESDCTQDQDGCLNYNKVLFVEPSRNTLITCGSDSQGTCQQRHLETLMIVSRSEVSVSAGRDKTTVSLLAPGPESRDWLYVATAYSDLSRTVPPITRRDLDLAAPPSRLLTITDQSFVRFTSSYRSNPFDINYVYGFTFDTFIYFVTAQQPEQSTTPTFVSKVVRVCQDSGDFDSYTEITLQCGNGPNLYSLAQAAYFGAAGPALAQSLGIDPGAPMLFAVFAKNVGSTNVPSDSSALCAFSMADIEEAFGTAVGNCLQQGAAYQVPYVEGSTCNTLYSSVDYTTVLCNAVDTYKFANNPDGVPAVPLLQLEGTRMSPIVTSVEMNHTVAFIGTSQGTLLKVHIDNGTAARHYETIQLEGSPVLTDISLNEQLGHINLLTEQQFLQLRVENCNQYTSCESCIGEARGQDGDPYCGWCTLQNKCTKHSECPLADVSSRWLPYNTAQCVGISQTHPKNLPITDPAQMITLTVEQLPVLQDEETYSCQFDDLPLSPGTTNSNTIECRTPDPRDIPPIPPMENHAEMQLSVYSSETNINFISGVFNFYDCSRHSSCTPCVTSDWDCDWCVYDNRCTHTSEECSSGDYIVTGNNNPNDSMMRGPSFCPQLQEQMGEVLVPVGISSVISVNASNLPDPSRVTMPYQCSLSVEGVEQTTSATVMSNDVIQCNSKMYNYQADLQTFDVLLKITWNGNRRLDDSHNFNVTLYKCDVDRQDCSRCLSSETTRPELGCRWCSSSSCAFKDDPLCNSVALDSNDPCPAPHLEKVDPLTGPMEGNTIIEISGKNIGRSFQDVVQVMVGQKPCDLTGLGDKYITGRSVRCRTAPIDLETSQAITLTAVTPPGGSNLSSTGNVNFNYTNPVISGFSPNVGPEAGGTVITITGTHMNTGRDIRVMTGSDISCMVNSSSVSLGSVMCRTGMSAQVGDTGPVSVIFDGATRTSDQNFTYQANPTVDNINPTESILSGGRTVNVNGRNFEQIQDPQIIAYLYLERDGINKSFTDVCNISNNTLMTCQTPDLSYNESLLQLDNKLPVVIGFIMADVQDLRRWSEKESRSMFSYVGDPIYTRFDDVYKLTDDKRLTIKGERLDDALTEEEVKVFIGTETCILTTAGFTSTILICKVPEVEPEPLFFNGNSTPNGYPAVLVQHSSLQFHIGFVDYGSGIDIGLIVGIVAAGLLIPLLLLALFQWHRLRGSRKEIGAIMIRMEEVENGMAEELRIAFAELQTNVTDLTHDLAGTGMPFVSHRQYATNMLFIGLDVKPETSDPQMPEENVEKAMAVFLSLLTNKSFLLAFIQAIDDDKSIAMKNKSTVASLLTVLMVLEDKLGYLTDIMITLMSRQVQEAVDNNRPKQLFRRTESIVEKLLSNWIALCLYDQLKNRTAFPLFLLYSGIKVQTEKGPVDAVTRQAHFSLSEERLLKANIEFQEMTLNVVVDNADGEKKEVKVLNVDAIPQVKEKILDSMYRNKPYSDRQRAEDVELEWRQGKSGRLVLRDVVLPQMIRLDSKEKQTWQKLSTLSELGVPDGSLMALVPKQSSSTINEATSGYSPSHELATEDGTSYEYVDSESGTFIWHLEKPQEDIDETGKQRRNRQRQIALGMGKKSQKITFPRLLTMKGIVQEYVDKMFHAILTAEGTPLAIKYLFDFFDSQAIRHDIGDPEIPHIWKSNTLPLRFWVSAITHPNYIFDIRPTPSVESSLGVVGQAFYDACNKSDHQLGWESSFNKLLYNREVTRYRDLVESYYNNIEDMQQVPKNVMDRELSAICKNFTGLFSKLSTLLQLYDFTKRNKKMLMSAIEDDEVCESDGLVSELEEIEVLLKN